jgi:hypothetical protein
VSEVRTGGRKARPRRARFAGRRRARGRGTTGAGGRELNNEEGGALEGVHLGYGEEGAEELGNARSATVRKSLRS